MCFDLSFSPLACRPLSDALLAEIVELAIGFAGNFDSFEIDDSLLAARGFFKIRKSWFSTTSNDTSSLQQFNLVAYLWNLCKRILVGSLPNSSHNWCCWIPRS